MSAARQTYGIRVARPTKEDLDAAFDLATLLEALERGHDPAQDTMCSGVRYFDPHDIEQLQALHQQLLALERRGSLFRVVCAIHTLLSPDNALLDPDDSCLALHPRLLTLARQGQGDGAIMEEPDGRPE